MGKIIHLLPRITYQSYMAYFLTFHSGSVEILKVCQNGPNRHTIVGPSQDTTCKHWGDIIWILPNYKSPGIHTTLEVYNITPAVCAPNTGLSYRKSQLCFSNIHLLLNNYTASQICKRLPGDRNDNTTTNSSSCQCVPDIITPNSSHSLVTPGKYFECLLHRTAFCHSRFTQH